MLITPRPGAERKNIRQVLSGVHSTAMNLQRPYLTAFEGLWTYLEWATESARMLRSQISDRDLDVLNVRIVEIAGLIARLQGLSLDSPRDDRPVDGEIGRGAR
ncbi:hypothetical protein ACPCAJ_33540 [Streptomyces griseoincarnatus]